MSLVPEDWDWWWGAWKNRIRCGSCRALMSPAQPCPVCGQDYRNLGFTTLVIDGGRTIVAPPVFQGALDWSPYVLLQLIHREWLRPPAGIGGLPQGSQPSPRVLIVLTFWIFFETLMDWFYDAATRELPPAVGEDLRNRYRFIGARLTRLHRILFGTTYGEDLDSLSFSSVRQHLEKVQTQRNAFVHGRPEAINDALVEDTVNMMPSFQDAWIQTFNKRCAKHP